MAKLRLITASQPEYIYLILPWVRPLYQDYFDIEPYDPNQQYDPKSCCVLINYVEQLEKRDWYQPLANQGLRLLVEHLGDSDVDRASHGNHQELTLRSGNWMWYNSCLDWTWHGTDQYQPDRNYQYSFLMPMNQPRWHRDRCIRDLKDLLPEALYSYASRGRELPGDPPATISWRSWLNPDWYNSTPYSIVVESYMRSRYNLAHPTNYRTEVSEKIFKPMLGQQPFIVYGSVDTVKYLRREGFVTYDNLFDESYDTTVEDQDRFTQVTAAVRQAVKEHNYRTFQIDPETQRRIDHNRNRLFDVKLVQQRFRDEIVKDIVEWFES